MHTFGGFRGAPMCRRSIRLFAFIIVVGLAATAKDKDKDKNKPKGAAPAAAPAAQPLSQRVVAYQIDAHFDAARNTVDATEILTYHNLTVQPHYTFRSLPYLPKLAVSATTIR